MEGWLKIHDEILEKKKAHSVSFRPSFARFWSAVDWGRTSNTRDATVSCWSTWSQKNFTGCIQIWLSGRWNSATRAITWKLSGGTDRLWGRLYLILSCRVFECYLLILKALDKLAWCFCFLSECRYDLRIRYVPVNFLEKFKDDRSTLLYFYQQVTNYSVFYCNFLLEWFCVDRVCVSVCCTPFVSNKSTYNNVKPSVL